MLFVLIRQNVQSLYDRAFHLQKCATITCLLATFDHKDYGWPNWRFQ